MTTPLFSVNAAAEVLERDRRTIVKALRRVKPDGKKNSQSRWRLKTILDALAAMQPAPAPNTTQIEPQLAALYAKFDSADAAMRKLKTLDARRKAAITMAPLIAEMDAVMRKVGTANGQDPELVSLRADRLFALYLRGFETCCGWSQSEVWEAIDIRD